MTTSFNSSAPSAPPAGITGNVLILRKTDVGDTGLTDAKAVFSPGTAINAADLNKNQTQVLRAILDLRDTNMSLHGRGWAYDASTPFLESQETRLYSDLNMTGREINNVGKIKFDNFSYTEGGVEVERQTRDIPTDADLALKENITDVDAKLAANVVNEDAKLALKDDSSVVDAKLVLNVINEDIKLSLKEDITSVNTKLEQNVINENAKLALKDDITSVDAKLANKDDINSVDTKLLLKDDVTSVNSKLAQNVAGEDIKLALKEDITTVDQKLALNVANENAKLALKEDTGVVDTKLALKDDITNVDSKLATKADLSGGKLLVSQLPEIAVTDFLGGVANQSSMLALTGQKGDWCTRTDDGKIYIITGADPTLISDWTELTYPAAPVTSVAGRTGVVTLSTSDIAGLGTASGTASTDYATAAQGTLADSATQPADLAVVQADVDQNEADADAAIAAVQADVDQNETDGDTADAALSGRITTLEADPTTATAVAAVQADVDQNEVDADAALAAVQADVDQNEADCDSAITAVQADVDANEAAALAGRNTIQADVDANEAAALAARNVIQADVDQNEADSDAADLALSNRLNTLEADPTTASAVAAVQADVDLNEANLATVATSGSYNDLSGKPTLGTAAATDATAYATATQGSTADTAVQPGDLSTVATSGSYSDLSGKPSIPTIDPDTVIDANYVATDENFTTADHTKLDGIAAGAEVNVVTSVASKTGAVTLVKGDVGLGNIDNTTDANKPVSTATQTALDAKADLTGGKLNTSQLPDIAIAEYKGNVANQTAMLAVTGEKGDWVIRNDDSKVYVITGTDPTDAGDWTALSYPAGFSGAYNDLSGKPTLGTAAATATTDYATATQGGTADSAVQPADLHTVATSGSYSDLSNKPTIPTNNSSLTNGAGYITSFDITTQTDSKYLKSNENDSFSGNLTGSGTIYTTGTYMGITGDGGGVCLTTNDGGGNANVTFNHKSMVPDKTGSSGRIECAVDSNAAVMYFELKDNVTSGTSIGLTNILTLTTSNFTAFGNTVWHAGNGGAGTGLDADKLDGIQASSFLRSDTDDTMTGALTIDVDNKANGALRINANQTNPNNDFYFAQEIYSTLSGSTTTTADREQGGIYMDINSTATGGGTNHEHRAYGIFIDLDSTGDADMVVGVHANTTVTPSTGTHSNVFAGYFYAEDNGGAGSVTNIQAVRGLAVSDNSTSDTNSLVGGYFKAYNAADTGNIGEATAVYGEIEIPSGTGDHYGNSYVFRAEYDNNDSTAQTNNTYLYYGNYAGTSPTNAYGIYIEDAVPNYLPGTLTCGTIYPHDNASSSIGSFSDPWDKGFFDEVDIGNEVVRIGDYGLEVGGQAFFANIVLDPQGNLTAQGDASISGINIIHSGLITLSGNKLGGMRVTISDDAFATITPPKAGCGYVTVVEGGDEQYPRANCRGFIYADWNTSPVATGVNLGSEFEISTSGPPTGTTGSDNHATLFSGGSAGKLYLENRTGGTGIFFINFI